ncbi:MAG: hypothetical protein IKP91_08595 [Bacteroidaceae bacterium]|nr:hypothetical protein [Bacteroidaceae bacterium]
MKRFFTIVGLMALSLLGARAAVEIGQDVTTMIADPGMEAVANWTNNGFKINNRGTNYTLFSGNFIEQWKASTSSSEAFLDDIDIHTTISVDNGVYLFSAAVIACQQSGTRESVSGVSLYANADAVACSTGDGAPERFYVMTTVTDGSLTLGFKTESTDANWIAWDNAELYFYGDAAVEQERAVAILTLKANLEAVAYHGDTKMQKSAWEALVAAMSRAEYILFGETAEYFSTEDIIAANATLASCVATCAASVEAYANLAAAIESEQAVYEEYQENDDAAKELGALVDALTAGQTMYDEATSDVSAIEAQIDAMANASAIVKVAVKYFEVADALGYIEDECEVGTVYGKYPQYQMDNIINVHFTLDALYEAYIAGNATAADVLAQIVEAEAAIEKFYQSMITNDFTQPLNFLLWPVDSVNVQGVNEHDLFFEYPGEEGNPFSYALYATSTSTFTPWTGCQEGGSGKGDAGVMAWWLDNSTNAWLYMQADGLLHPMPTLYPSVLFSAPEDGVYVWRSSVSSRDENRKLKNRGDLWSAVYYISGEEGTISQIGENAVYNWGTDPSDFNFYINLKAGDQVALVAGINQTNGNALSSVDTLYVLGQKDEDNVWTKADAEASGLLFFNPYIPAEEWTGLDEAIQTVAGVLTDNEENMGDGFGQYPEAAFHALDSIRGLGARMLSAGVASQPEVDAMSAKLLGAIETFYNSAGYALAIGVEEAPNDSTIFVNHQYMPSGLYYIRDIASGLYATAPASEGDKQPVPLAELIDESMTVQNAQVWHFAYNEKYWTYSVVSHGNDGTEWTIEDELSKSTDNSIYQGYYHFGESGTARWGNSLYLADDGVAVWRTFRIYTNGSRYSMTAASDGNWIYTFGASGMTVARVDITGALNFAFELIPFDNGTRIDSTMSDPVSTSQTIYNLQGVKTGTFERGINIVRTVRADGSVDVRKVLVR